MCRVLATQLSAQMIIIEYEYYYIYSKQMQAALKNINSNAVFFLWWFVSAVIVRYLLS